MKRAEERTDVRASSARPSRDGANAAGFYEAGRVRNTSLVIIQRADIELPEDVTESLWLAGMEAGENRLPMVMVAGELLVLAAKDFRAWYGPLPTDPACDGRSADATALEF